MMDASSDWSSDVQTLPSGVGYIPFGSCDSSSSSSFSSDRSSVIQRLGGASWHGITHPPPRTGVGDTNGGDGTSSAVSEDAALDPITTGNHKSILSLLVVSFPSSSAPADIHDEDDGSSRSANTSTKNSSIEDASFLNNRAFTASESSGNGVGSSSLEGASRRPGAFRGGGGSSNQAPNNQQEATPANSRDDARGGGGRVGRDPNQEKNVASSQTSLSDISVPSTGSILERHGAEIAETRNMGMGGTIQWKEFVVTPPPPGGCSQQTPSFGFPVSANLSLDDDESNATRSPGDRTVLHGGTSYYDGSTLTSGPTLLPNIGFHENNEAVAAAARSAKEAAAAAVGGGKPSSKKSKDSTNSGSPWWLIIALAALMVLILVAVAGAAVCGLGHCSILVKNRDDAASTAADSKVPSPAAPTKAPPSLRPPTVRPSPLPTDGPAVIPLPNFP